MSVTALDWARRRHEITGPSRAVLYVLAWHANAAGESWPSQPTIVAESGVSERTVRDALPALEALGAIARAGYRPGGGVVIWRLAIALEHPAGTDLEDPLPGLGDPAGAAGPNARSVRHLSPVGPAALAAKRSGKVRTTETAQGPGLSEISSLGASRQDDRPRARSAEDQ